jgi:bla regulator protein blaR1
MSHRVPQRLNVARKLLPGAGAATILIPVGVVLFSAPVGLAQQTAEPPERPLFAVASIKPSNRNDGGPMINLRQGGSFSASNVTLRFLIKFAYDLGDEKISGGPNWIDSKRYDVDANSDPPFGGEFRRMTDEERKEYFHQLRLRLQSLLADRFQLKISHGTKDMSMYDLVVAKNGPKLKEAQGPGPKLHVSRNETDLSGANMEDLAGLLSDLTSRSVIDKTGLTGRYDIKLEFTPDSSLAFRQMGPGAGGSPGAGPAGALQPPPAESTGPTLLTALQEELGLKLESHRGPADIVNVDSARLPSEN